MPATHQRTCPGEKIGEFVHSRGVMHVYVDGYGERYLTRLYRGGEPGELEIVFGGQLSVAEVETMFVEHWQEEEANKALTPAKRIDIEIRLDESRPSTDFVFWNAIVTNAKGFAFYLTYTNRKPSKAEVRKVWFEERSAFSPWTRG